MGTTFSGPVTSTNGFVGDLTGNVTGNVTGTVIATRAALAAAGSTASDAAVISTQVVAVTASDGTKGVALPAAATTAAPILVINTVLTSGANLNVYPVSGGNDNINGGAEDAAFVMGPGEAAWFTATSATQWYVSDKSGNLLTTTEVNLLDGLLATAAEINRAADVSTRLIAAGSALAVTEAAHDGKTILLDTAAGSTCTLPAATGSGARFRFVIKTIATSNSHIVKVTGNDVMYGSILVAQDAGDTAVLFETAADSDTITLNRTTTGSTMKGEFVELEDIDTDVWAVWGVIAATGSEATPFSATV